VSHSLRFGTRIDYDPARSSITLSVRLLAGSAWVDTEAKLDTGSSHSVFARELSDTLGLDLEAGERLRIRTVTGWFHAYGHAVTVRVADLDLDATIYFAADYGFPRNVLGRHGWIERLRLGLIDYDGALFASHYDDPAE